MIKGKGISAAVLLALLVTGCCFLHSRADEEIANLGPRVTGLSGMLEVMNKRLPRDIPEAEFINRSVERDPSVLVPFVGLKLHTNRGGNHVLLLVCDGGDKIAYYEDSSSTSKCPDRNYSLKERPPCNFTLDPGVKYENCDN